MGEEDGEEDGKGIIFLQEKHSRVAFTCWPEDTLLALACERKEVAFDSTRTGRTDARTERNWSAEASSIEVG